MLTAIVLAAGSSRRMGKNKLLLPYRGGPLLAYVTGNILSAKVGPVIVVTGHDAGQIGEALKGLQVQLIHNPMYDTGMTSSIQAGVNAAGGDGYMICLSDMALIRPEEYRLLKNAFDKEYRRDKACIIQPVYDNQTGNPVIFSAAWRQAILEQNLDSRRLTDPLLEPLRDDPRFRALQQQPPPNQPMAPAVRVVDPVKDPA